jgi:phospholipid/cholesterol/gamma-HCH transport system ATP-binding protein
MIEFRNVCFSYGDKPVLKNLSFFIPAGEARVIMGQSGSGKSTILRLILGLVSPQEGEILIDERNICRAKDSELREIRKRIGMVFQEGALFDSLTVGENVGYYLLEHSRMKFTDIADKVKEMLGFVGLSEDIIDQLPDELSGGMQRRVAIGRALLSTDPKIMLYDEPTTGLDPKMTTNIVNLINRLTEVKNVTSIIVTHQIADAFEVAEKFIIIDSGENIFDGDTQQLRQAGDPRIVEFLKPFRDSIANVQKKDFI